MARKNQLTANGLGGGVAGEGGSTPAKLGEGQRDGRGRGHIHWGLWNHEAVVATGARAIGSVPAGTDTEN